MTVGERIKQRRKELKIPVETIARELGVSYTTIYRYEDSSIEKIPFQYIDKICGLLKITPAELLGGGQPKTAGADVPALPKEFENVQDAMEFILRNPLVAAYGEYDPDSMSDETILDFANEILQQLKLVSYKYKVGREHERKNT